MSEDSEVPDSNQPPVQSKDYSAPPTYQQAYAPPPSAVNKLIPTSNPKALMAYYLGIFGLIPGFCIFLGPAAIVLGVMGLRAVNENPQIAGKAHAWIGIVLGGVSTLACLVVVLLIVFAR